VQQQTAAAVAAATGSKLGQQDLSLLGAISDVVYSNSKKLKTVFHELDTDGSGMISASELTRGLKKLGVMRLSPEEGVHLVQLFDAHGMWL
jgi:Ca2+-binding EF-hand superfamily protein